MTRAMLFCENTARSAQRSCAGFACHTAKITMDAVSASIFALISIRLPLTDSRNLTSFQSMPQFA